MSTNTPHDIRIAKLTFAEVFPHYVSKIEKKGRTMLELLQVIEWLTGFNEDSLKLLISQNVTFEVFFDRATLNVKSQLITGLICGYRIEEIQNPLTRKIRYLDKLVDELAKGKKLEKILRD